jgi:hypothetical protein
VSLKESNGCVNLDISTLTAQTFLFSAGTAKICLILIALYHFLNIAPAIKYLNIVIPAKAGIQVGTGCRSKIPHSSGIKSGMTGLVYLVARVEEFAMTRRQPPSSSTIRETPLSVFSLMRSFNDRRKTFLCNFL